MGRVGSQLLLETPRCYTPSNYSDSSFFPFQMGLGSSAEPEGKLKPVSDKKLLIISEINCHISIIRREIGCKFITGGHINLIRHLHYYPQHPKAFDSATSIAYFDEKTTKPFPQFTFTVSNSFILAIFSMHAQYILTIITCIPIYKWRCFLCDGGLV